jgi:transcriptional regulator with XRE-family HTH domain
MRLGVTQQTLSTLERNSIKISAARLLQVLQLFGVELVLRQVSATAIGYLPSRHIFFSHRFYFGCYVRRMAVRLKNPHWLKAF